MSDKQDPFFVGYLPAPKSLRWFLAGVSLLLILAFPLFSWAVSVTQEDPGPSGYRFDFGRQTLTGTITLDPYPTLHVTEGSELVAAGETILLAGVGKFGVANRVSDFDGALATLQGIILDRGDLRMMQVAGGRRGVMAAEGEAPTLDIEPLGRWRLSGEICDGKCLAGAMRPGNGIGHRACAQLCLVGEVPPVFVASEPINGHEFFLIGTADGAPIGRDLIDFVGLYVEAEGEISLRGGLPVLIIDPETVESL